MYYVQYIRIIFVLNHALSIYCGISQRMVWILRVGGLPRSIHVRRVTEHYFAPSRLSFTIVLIVTSSRQDHFYRFVTIGTLFNDDSLVF